MEQRACRVLNLTAETRADVDFAYFSSSPKGTLSSLRSGREKSAINNIRERERERERDREREFTPYGMMFLHSIQTSLSSVLRLF